MRSHAQLLAKKYGDLFWHAYQIRLQAVAKRRVRISGWVFLGDARAVVAHKVQDRAEGKRTAPVCWSRRSNEPVQLRPSKVTGSLDLPTGGIYVAEKQLDCALAILPEIILQDLDEALRQLMLAVLVFRKRCRRPACLCV